MLPIEWFNKSQR